MGTLRIIWEFIKKYWLLFVGFLAGIFVYAKFFGDNQSQSDSSPIAQKERDTNEAVRKAEKIEAQTVNVAERTANSEKENRDAEIKEQRKDDEAKLDSVVTTNIEQSIGDSEKLASDFASTFGGTYVKKDQE